MEGAKRILIVVDRAIVSLHDYKELLESLKERGLDVIGLLCKRFDSKPIEMWNLDNLSPVEMEEIRVLMKKVVR